MAMSAWFLGHAYPTSAVLLGCTWRGVVNSFFVRQRGVAATGEHQPLSGRRRNAHARDPK
jgi:hypothetical protein